MSRTAEALSTAYALSLTSAEEASRWGRKKIDIEHLFLAVLLNEQPAGQALRSLGITLDAARKAIEEQHAHQMSSIGVNDVQQPIGRITLYEAKAHFDWSENAKRTFQGAGKGRRSRQRKQGNAADVLRELLEEPSGFIAAVLERLGTNADEGRERLAEIESRSASRQPDRKPSQLSVTKDTFIPASAEEVFALVSDPERIPDWDTAGSDVEHTGKQTWEALLPAAWPNGKPRTPSEEKRRQVFELMDAAEPHRVVWRVSFPGNSVSKPHCRAIRLWPTDGGTHMRFTVTYPRDAHRLRRLVGTAVRPGLQPLLWVQAAHLSTQISLNFR
ncbi:SRPBCC family protein [Nesterenkonia populi]|uniref:SRPBCC family protein n=1 Tax=Nesterenkonia populi TaxID=1591087 RepID=UPI0011BDD339|nr:Clp protease N-terminal domain-containing protein [Nesterenkonia populi]